MTKSARTSANLSSNNELPKRISPSSPCNSKFILPRRSVVSTLSCPKNDRLPLCLAKISDCTNIPPDPHAGSNTCPSCGSIIATSNLTTERGVKNSPPRVPSVEAKLVMKYSYTRPSKSLSLPASALNESREKRLMRPETFSRLRLLPAYLRGSTPRSSAYLRSSNSIASSSLIAMSSSCACLTSQSQRAFSGTMKMPTRLYSSGSLNTSLAMPGSVV